MKRFFRSLSSMRTAIILLSVLAAACCAASFVTQGQSYSWYAAAYGERLAGLIMALHIDDAFHSWWFVAISGFLCCNLLACNLIRLPQLVRRFRAHGSSEGLSPSAFQLSATLAEDLLPASADASGQAAAAAETSSQAVAAAEASGDGMPRSVFSRLGLRPEEAGDGKLFAAKNGIGLWGAWICHLGILLLILGFSLGQFTHREWTVYGVPGQTRTIGDTGCVLRIDSFDVGLRDDDTVEQYTAGITVWKASSESSGVATQTYASSSETAAAQQIPAGSQSAEISVNHPAKLFGMKFYQNSTGWAARLTLTREGELLADEILCAGEYIPVPGMPELVIYFNAFYPDYVLIPGSGPATKSGQILDPAYLYTVYYQGNVLGMNVLMGDEPLTIDEYRAVFTEPQSYTLIQVKQDRFAWLALIGGVLVMAGLFLAFYLQPVRLMAERAEDGSWTFYGSCPRGGVLFRRRFLEACGQAPDEKGAVL